jgi:hypothetical protein
LENKWWKRPSGLKIDPKTAEVVWGYALTRDPDGKHQVVREYFARSPGSGAWVNFHDLPEATRDALWKKHRRKLAFPPGLQARLTAEARRASMSNTEQPFADPNRHVVEVPDSFAIARWPRDADVPAIERGEAHDIQPGTMGMIQAEIAKRLIAESPDLLAEDKRPDLIKAVNLIYDRDHVVKVTLTDEDLANARMVATHEDDLPQA